MQHVYQKGNVTADCLARMAREQSLDGPTFSILDEPPDDVRYIPNLNVLGASGSISVDMENHSRSSATVAEIFFGEGETWHPHQNTEKSDEIITYRNAVHTK